MRVRNMESVISSRVRKITVFTRDSTRLRKMRASGKLKIVDARDTSFCFLMTRRTYERRKLERNEAD